PAAGTEGGLLAAHQHSFEVTRQQGSRGVPPERDLTNGQGKYCAGLGIARTLDAVDLCDASSPLFLARNPRRAQLPRELGPVIQGRRVGLTRAADWPLRFYLHGSHWVSRREIRPAGLARETHG